MTTEAVTSAPQRTYLLTSDDDSPEGFGSNLCRYQWAQSLQALRCVHALNKLALTTSDAMMFLATMRRLPQRFGSQWTYRAQHFFQETVINLHVIVMNRHDVTDDVKAMCLSFLVYQDRARAESYIHQGWEWLQHTADDNILDIVYTYRHLVPDLPVDEWIDARRFTTLATDRETDHDDDDYYQERAPTPDRAPHSVLTANVLVDRQNVHTEGAVFGFHESLSRLLNAENSALITQHLGADATMDAHDYCLAVMRADPEWYNDRILHDPTVFPCNHRNLHLTDVFALVHRTARINEHSTDALQRLQTELQDASGTCSTGHAMRMVNALAGLHPDVHIGASDASQVRIYIQHVLQQEATRDGVTWFEGAEFDRWVRGQASGALIACFQSKDELGGLGTWKKEWQALFPACSVQPFSWRLRVAWRIRRFWRGVGLLVCPHKQHHHGSLRANAPSSRPPVGAKAQSTVEAHEVAI